MYRLSHSSILFLLWTCAWSSTFANQIPVIDGIIGGLPKPNPVASSKPQLKTNVQTTPGELRITENSGICETTPGVYQASGYADLSATESLWFWFFEARNNANTAPLAIWLNGGPGSSSMIGLLQENGPCRIRNDSSGVDLNPYSWNNNVNMLYLDQPVGTGFSHGDLNVGTSQQAAEDIWKFMQIFFADPRFSKFAMNDFAIWTESYGGHYGPVTAAHFLNQNVAIANGSISGTPILLKALGIGDGLTDPMSQYPGYLSYSMHNNYHPLVDSETFRLANDTMYRPFGCLDRINSCQSFGFDATNCSMAQLICNYLILTPLAGEYDVYDIRALNPDSYSPSITEYLTDSAITAKIGAESTWQQSNTNVYGNFGATGDWMITSRPQLEFVIEEGVRTLIYGGDADYIVCYIGLETMLDSLQTRFKSSWQSQSMSNWTVQGQSTGVFKNSGNLSYLRVFGAGHEVPAYKYGTLATGQAALKMFEQITFNQPISST